MAREHELAVTVLERGLRDSDADLGRRSGTAATAGHRAAPPRSRRVEERRCTIAHQRVVAIALSRGERDAALQRVEQIARQPVVRVVEFKATVATELLTYVVLSRRRCAE